MTATSTECPLLDNELRFDFDTLRDCGDDFPRYADLLQSGIIPKVVEINISMCPVEYDFSDLFKRHEKTIAEVKIQYVCHLNDYPNFPGAMLRLASILKDLPELRHMSIHGDARSLFPVEFLECLPDFRAISSLSLCGSFEFSMLPLQQTYVDDLSIKEENCTESGGAVDLSKWKRLQMLSVSAKRKLILPAQNFIFDLRVRNVISLVSGKLSNLRRLTISDCAPCVVKHLLELTDITSLQHLLIESMVPLDLLRGIDARKLDYLHLSNIALEYIDTCEEKPLKSLCLINSTITTAVSGMKFHAISAYVSCNEPSQVNNLNLDRNILKSLGLGREAQHVREMTDLDTRMMQAVDLFKEKLELFVTLAPITNFPEMPLLKYLALYSDAECDLAIGKVPRLIELATPCFLWEKRRGVDPLPWSKNQFDTFQYWSSRDRYILFPSMFGSYN